PGTCRDRHLASSPAALRVRVNHQDVCFTDRRLGLMCQNLGAEVGDFVLRRRDGVITYQLAVVVDDAAQGVTHVVRGADLIDSTPRQIHLQPLLGLPLLTYLHTPL